MSEVTLYHIPPSPYSQIARIVLAEKGVRWSSKVVGFEMYEPWYMRLNPGGTVPTMVHDGHSVPDSFAIARYVDAHFEGPPLIPKAKGARAEVERWIGKLGDIPVRELTYGTGKLVSVGAMLNRYRIRILKRHERKNPDMAEVYRAKQRDIEGYLKHTLDSAHMARIREQAMSTLDEMEGALEENRENRKNRKKPWLCGAQYSMADAFWTVAVAHFILLKLDPLRGRPALEAWYARAKARPSFETGEVWESQRISRILRVVLEKFGLRLAAIVLAIAALWALLWWLL